MKKSPIQLVLVLITALVFVGNSICLYYLCNPFISVISVKSNQFLNLICVIIIVGTTLTCSFYFWKLVGTEISSHQFFFIIAIGITSLLITLRFFLIVFQEVFSESILLVLIRIFSFLYISMVFILMLSFILIGTQKSNNILILLISMLLSALISQAGIFAYSQAVGIFRVFMGGGLLLPIIGVFLIVIALGIYCIDMLYIQVRGWWIIKQAVTLMGFVLSVHTILLFSEVVFILPIATVLLVVCLIFYLRGVFIQLF